MQVSMGTTTLSVSYSSDLLNEANLRGVARTLAVWQRRMHLVGFKMMNSNTETSLTETGDKLYQAT